MANIIQIRRDTAANWSSANPVLAQGELGIETDTHKIKPGDGLTSWNSLAYLVSGGVGDLVAANNLSDVASAATAFSNIKQAATESATGVVELATTTEATTGTDTTRAVTPAGVKAVADTKANASHTHAESEITNLESHLAAKAPIASPTFTGTVTAPDVNLSGATASTIASFDASKNIESLPTATYPSLTELSYVKGVTSAIQTQINTKAPTASPALTGNVGIDKTASYKLDAAGTINAYGASSDVYLRCERGDNTKTASVLIVPQGTLSSSNVQWLAGLASSSNSFFVSSYDGTSVTQRIFLQNDGDFGVGIDPQSRLHFKQSSDGSIAGSFMITSTDGYTGGIYRNAGSSGAMVLRNNSADTITLYGGCAGFGASTPSAKVEMAGTSATVLLRATNTTAGSDQFVIVGSLLGLASTSTIEWSSDSSGGNAGDVGLARSDTSTLKVTDGSTGWGKLQARRQLRVGSTTSSATPTINTDSVDLYRLTAQSANITSFTTNLSGTPTDGQSLLISITDDGTARTITWGTSFESSGTISLPSTTIASTRMDIGLIWNTVTSKWRCVGVA